MATLPPAISNSGAGGKKPFSYCPGGIDFSELKSPKIARRIAKHQAGINEPPSSPSTLPNQKVSYFTWYNSLKVVIVFVRILPLFLHHHNWQTNSQQQAKPMEQLPANLSWGGKEVSVTFSLPVLTLQVLAMEVESRLLLDLLCQ